MSTAFTLTNNAGLFHLTQPLQLQSGETLESAILGFEEQGPKDAPVVLVLGGISAGRHLSSSKLDQERGWWEGFVGRERAIDSERFRVVGVDYLGGVGASSGPENSGLGETFPIVSSRDQAAAIVQLLDALEIPRLHSLVGSSFGGMVGLALAEQFPDRLKALICLSAAHESHPSATALRSIQRRILELGLRENLEAETVSLARGLAMISYRSPEEFAQRFSSTPKQNRFEVEDYLESRGRDFANRFDALSYLRLSLGIDLHRVCPEKIRTRTHLVGVSSDQLVPISQIHELAKRLTGPVISHEIQSIYGHDAFLKEETQLRPILKQVLEEN